MDRRLAGGLGGLLLLALAAAALWYLHDRPRPATLPPPVADAPAGAAPPASAAAPVPAIRYPVEAGASAPGAGASLPEALAELLGAEPLGRYVVTDDFVRRAVATVDNLTRERASARLWPVTPTPGRFTPTPRDGREWLGAANASRYEPFVRFVETVDPARAVALYRRFYPQFQQAYVELGYPRGYFNDRLIDVIDHLLQTPVPAGPVEVRRAEVRGPVQPARPWVLYEFADPALASRSAGQQLLLRIGPEPARRLKARLQLLRDELVAPAGR